jgi:four helix bundle protein
MSFDKLRVYGAAVRLNEEVKALLPRLKRACWNDAQQLEKACTSISLNIAEAYGLGDGRKASHLRIARGSADETRAALRSLLHAKALDLALAQRLMNQSRLIAKMLTSLIDTCEDT